MMQQVEPYAFLPLSVPIQGEALDQKTPLLPVLWKPSITQALRLLRLFGNTTSNG